MTYLEAVNKVLRRLREDEVVSVSSNPYSKLIGELVNDAKRIVEDAWDWSSMRTTLTVDTTAGVFSYNLVGSGTGLKTLDVINDTSNVFMKPATSSWMNNVFLNQEPPQSSPCYYAWNGFNNDGYAVVDIYPIPDKVYNLRFNVVNRDAEFTNDTDVLNVPSAAVVQFAQAMAIEERGETGGTSSNSMMAMAKSTLSDAIAMDAARFPSETIWTDV